MLTPHDTPKKESLSIESIDAGRSGENTPFKETAFMSQRSLFISNNLTKFNNIFQDKPLSWRVAYVIKQELKREFKRSNDDQSNDQLGNSYKIQQVLGDVGDGAEQFYQLSDTDEKRLNLARNSTTLLGTQNNTFFAQNKLAKPKPMKCFLDKYVISTNSTLRPIWDIVVFLLLAYTLIVLPVRVAFATEESSSYVLDIIIDILFLIDVFVSFLTPIELKDGKEVTNFWLIAKSYAQSWLLLDLIAIFPFYLLGSSELESLAVFVRIPRLFKVLRLMRLIKLMRVYRLQKFFNKVAYSPKIHQGVVRIVKLLIAVVTLTHFSACLWYFIGELGQDITGNSWILELEEEFSELSTTATTVKYIASLYFSVSALAAVGFGDIKPHNTVEMGFSIFLMLCGATAFSYITATISSLIHDFDQKALIYRQKMSNLVNFVRNSNLSPELNSQLMKEMSVIWQNQLQTQGDASKIKQDLTPLLLYQVSLEMHSDLIDFGHYFQLFANDVHVYPFIAELVSEFVPTTSFEGEFIASVGDECKFWAMIKRGNVVSIPAFDNNIELMSFDEGSSIGECAIFLTQNVWPWTLRCNTDTTYFTISTEIFTSIVSHHKTVPRILIKLAAQRCQRYTKMKNIQIQSMQRNKGKRKRDSSFHFRISKWMNEENNQIARSLTVNSTMCVKENECLNMGSKDCSFILRQGIGNKDEEMKKYIFEIRSLIHNDIDRHTAVGRWRLLRLYVQNQKKFNKMADMKQRASQNNSIADWNGNDAFDNVHQMIRQDTRCEAAEYQKALNVVLKDTKNSSWMQRSGLFKGMSARFARPVQ